MRKPTEKVQISYPGILDGTEYTVPQGLKYLKIPDPSNGPVVEVDVDTPMLEFTRVPYSNVFRLCH